MTDEKLVEAMLAEFRETKSAGYTCRAICKAGGEEGPDSETIARSAMRAALAVIRREEGWQPIETAPRDGTIIDLWHPDYGVVHNEWWDDDGWCGGLPDGFTHWRRDRAPDGSFACTHKDDDE